MHELKIAWVADIIHSARAVKNSQYLPYEQLLYLMVNSLLTISTVHCYEDLTVLLVMWLQFCLLLSHKHVTTTAETNDIKPWITTHDTFLLCSNSFILSDDNFAKLI